MIKEEMLQKSLELFASHGYENVGVQSIVELVGVTKPTLYHYFGSKEGLLTSILDTYSRKYFEGLIAESSYQQDIIQTVENVAAYYIREVERNPDLYRLRNSLQNSSPQSEAYRIGSKYYSKEIEILIDMFKRIGDHHTNLKGKEEMITYSLKGILDGYCIHTLLFSPSQAPMFEDPHKLAKQFLYGIFSL